MTVQEYLEQARDLGKQIKAFQDELIHIEALAESASSSYGQIRAQGSKQGSKVENYATLASDLTKFIKRDIKTMLKKQMEIRVVIKSVEDNTLQTLLDFYYLCGYTLVQVSWCMNYSERHIMRLHGEALKKIEEKHPEIIMMS